MPRVIEIEGRMTELLTRAEAGESMGVAPRTIWLWATRGVHGRKLGHVMLGGVKCYRKADLAAFIAVTPNTEPAQAPPVVRPRTSPESRKRLRDAGYKV